MIEALQGVAVAALVSNLSYVTFERYRVLDPVRKRASEYLEKANKQKLIDLKILEHNNGKSVALKNLMHFARYTPKHFQFIICEDEDGQDEVQNVPDLQLQHGLKKNLPGIFKAKKDWFTVSSLGCSLIAVLLQVGLQIFTSGSEVRYDLLVGLTAGLIFISFWMPAKSVYKSSEWLDDIDYILAYQYEELTKKKQSNISVTRDIGKPNS